ncbi:MAG: TadE/TadG family type IV pilus assembly protein [Dehalococcoidia bacterium]
MDTQSNEANMTGSRGNVLMRAFRRFRRTEAGQALVEFTMILPIFLLLLFALVDFGRGFYTWLLVTNAAREGARVAAVQKPQSEVYARIYDSFCDSYPTNCTLDPSKLSIDPDNIQGSRGQAVSIDLSYDFEFVTPIGNILALISGGSLTAPTITAHSSMRLE